MGLVGLAHGLGFICKAVGSQWKVLECSGMMDGREGKLEEEKVTVGGGNCRRGREDCCVGPGQLPPRPGQLSLRSGGSGAELLPDW